MKFNLSSVEIQSMATPPPPDSHCINLRNVPAIVNSMAYSRLKSILKERYLIYYVDYYSHVNIWIKLVLSSHLLGIQSFRYNRAALCWWNGVKEFGGMSLVKCFLYIFTLIFLYGKSEYRCIFGNLYRFLYRLIKSLFCLLT